VLLLDTPPRAGPCGLCGRPVTGVGLDVYLASEEPTELVCERCTARHARLLLPVQQAAAALLALVYAGALNELGVLADRTWKHGTLPRA
jgi:hypothetical protein